MRVFADLHAAGQTVIMVTHEPDIAAHADRVVVLRDGRGRKSDRLGRKVLRPRCACSLRGGGHGPPHDPGAEAQELLLAHRRADRGDVSDRRRVDRAGHEPLHGGPIRQHADGRQHLRAAAAAQHHRPATSATSRGSHGAAARGSAMPTPTTCASAIRTPGHLRQVLRGPRRRCTTTARWPRTSTSSAPRRLLRDQELRDRRRAAPSPPRRSDRAAGAGHRPGAGRQAASRASIPIGKKVLIGGLPYRVIGVVAKQGTLFGLSMDKFAIMPFSAHGRRLICPINILDALIVQTDDPTQMQRAMGETEAVMRSRRAAQARAGEQLRVPDGGGRAGHAGRRSPRSCSWRSPAWWPSRWSSAGS